MAVDRRVATLAQKKLPSGIRARRLSLAVEMQSWTTAGAARAARSNRSPAQGCRASSRIRRGRLVLFTFRAVASTSWANTPRRGGSLIMARADETEVNHRMHNWYKSGRAARGLGAYPATSGVLCATPMAEPRPEPDDEATRRRPSAARARSRSRRRPSRAFKRSCVLRT